MKPIISCTVRITLEAEDGPLSPADVCQARSDLKDAIQSRLFGEGFLADHITVADYEIRATQQSTKA